MATISAVTGTWTIGSGWPYPKLYFTDYYIMAVAVKGANLALYDMTNSGNVWTATERVDLGVASGITSVDVAGFNTYAMIVVNKGATKVIYEKNYSTKAITSTAVTTIPAANSVCNHNGRIVLGGLYSTGAPWSALTACSVAWGDIGSNILLPGMVSGTSDLTAGFAKMPWDENGNGQVYKVLPLGDAFAVYGDKGVALLKQVMVTDKPLMSVSHIGKIGTLSTYATNGNDKIHGFVDTNYDWNVVTNEGIKNLGYSKYLSLLTGTIVVSYEESNNRFYISNGSLCFVFTSAGMYSTHQCVSSIGKYKKILTGFVKENADLKIRLKTAAFDLDIQDMKTIESVETGLVYNTVADEEISGKLAVKYDYKGEFVEGSYIPLNARGIFTQKMTGREFKIYLQGDYEAGAEFRLNNIKPKIKYSDKRNTRGKRNAY